MGNKRTNNSSDENVVFKTPFANVEIAVHYPEENPNGYTRDISKALGYLGAFDGLKESST